MGAATSCTTARRSWFLHRTSDTRTPRGTSTNCCAPTHGGKALIAPVDIVFSEFDVLQPDVAFFRSSRRHLLRRDQAIRSAPDLVIEILSPGTERTDRGRKMQAYARFGVPEYWIVDPNRLTVEVLRLAEGGFILEQMARAADTLRSATFPDLGFPVERIFTE